MLIIAVGYVLDDLVLKTIERRLKDISGGLAPA
jgi:hypothetical protein